MIVLRRILSSLALIMLGSAPLITTGCAQFRHTQDSSDIQQVSAGKSSGEAPPLPAPGRVHVFLVRGVDPFDWSNFRELSDFLHGLGFHKIHIGHFFQGARFERELRRVHEEEPDARIVLIGFSFGANVVRSLANLGLTEGITIDLLVYFGGNTLHNEPRDQPENALKILNILASGCIWNGAWMDRAENIHERDVFHFGTPTHPYSLEVLTRELAIVAARAGCSERVEKFPFPVSATRLDPSWNFLEPLARLSSEGGPLSRGPSR